VNTRLLYVLAAGYFVISGLKIFNVITPQQAAELIGAGAIALHLLQIKTPAVPPVGTVPPPDPSGPVIPFRQ
jgi:hypothetical protein